MFLGQLAWFLYSTTLMAGMAVLLVIINSLVYWQVQNTPGEALVTKTVIAPNKKQLQAQLDQQLLVLELQPSHRDALYNLSLIYDQLGEEKLAQVYLEKAKLQDPNHSLFLSK